MAKGDSASPSAQSGAMGNIGQGMGQQGQGMGNIGYGGGQGTPFMPQRALYGSYAGGSGGMQGGGGTMTSHVGMPPSPNMQGGGGGMDPRMIRLFQMFNQQGQQRPQY